MMKICFAISECVPFIKTGGLAEVGGSLPKALGDQGCEVKVFLPLYQSINTQEHGLIFSQEMYEIPIKIGHKTEKFNVWYGKLPNSKVEVHFIDCPTYFHRPNPYTGDSDEDERFIFFQHAVIHVLQRYHWKPDIIHSNDWQTSLLPVFLKTIYNWDSLFSRTACVLSIHNIGYQGLFSKDSIFNAGLPEDHMYPGGPFELDGAFCFLKAGLFFSDIISTVSETYAKEIQTHEYGARLDGVLAMRNADLHGILNGIDKDEWNPKCDKYIPFNYDINNLQDKQKNKTALLKFANLPFKENIPTIGITSRLTLQKGFDLLQPIINKVMALPLQIVALGSGEPKYEDFFQWSANTFPDQFSTYIGYHGELSHLIVAGCDIFLMPSKYEPCGLNQMYSLNYGTIPIVRKTGGLADTVKDYHEFYENGNGFSFNDYTPYALYLTIRRTLDIFHQKKKWKEIMKRGMKSDFSWDKSAKKYIELYRIAKKKIRL